MSKPVTLTVTVPSELVEEIARRVSELMQDTPRRRMGRPGSTSTVPVPTSASVAMPSTS